jgi:chromosome segregation ATPase
LRKTIEDLKVEIFEIEEEKNSLVSTSNWQMSILEEKISREDDKIYKASQEYDSLKNKLADLLKITRKG